jgi:hypothetical protein
VMDFHEIVDITGDALIIAGVIFGALIWFIRAAQSQNSSAQAMQLMQLRTEFDDHLKAFGEHCDKHHSNSEDDHHA